MQNHSKKTELLLAAVVIARASSYLVSKLSMPLTACILGLLFAHEAISPARFSGCLLILGGILITNLPSVISKTGSGRASFRTVHGTACKNGSGSWRRSAAAAFSFPRFFMCV